MADHVSGSSPLAAGHAQNDEYPSWPEKKRGVQNALLRCALFVISKERPTLYTMSKIPSRKDIDARFKGERLNQTDLDLYALLLHLSRKAHYGATIRASAKSLLDELGRCAGGSDYADLDVSLKRLVAGRIEITFLKSNLRFEGSLIEKLSRCVDSCEYLLTLHPETWRLFEGDGYTELDWEVRKSLKGPMEKWLHGFYSTHASPFAMKVKHLRELSGSEVIERRTRLTDFRTSLLKSLVNLTNRKVIMNSKYDKQTDKVSVRPMNSNSQKRHIEKKTSAQNERDFTNSQENSA